MPTFRVWITRPTSESVYYDVQAEGEDDAKDKARQIHDTIQTPDWQPDECAPDNGEVSDAIEL